MMKYDTPHKVCDPVHGFIRINSVEKQLVDSIPFGRLRYIKQMGVAYLVYPGANHTRYEHSLGVMHLADKIFQTLFSWEKPPFDLLYWRQILRLAALCHDLGHLPFSHTAEKLILPEGGHEEMTKRIIESEPLTSLWRQVGKDAAKDILKLAISDHGLPMDKWERLLSKIITDDNFGADRIDYLLRDAYASGAGYGTFDAHQLIDSLRVTKENEPRIGVQMGGLQSVESLWVARYMMVSRVSHHPKVRLYSAHMARAMAKLPIAKTFTTSIEAYLDESDDTIMTAVRKLAKEGDFDAQVVLLQAKPFQQILWPGRIDECSLTEKFSRHVLIDYPLQKKGERRFPILIDEAKTISSEQASPFLANIPLGANGPYLFAHPDKRALVLDYLEGSVGSDAPSAFESPPQES